MAQDKAKRSAYNKKHYAKNKEKVKARSKKWRAENKDEKATYDKQYRLDHKDEAAAYQKKREARNPTYFRQRARAGNANKFGISLEDALAKQDNRCAMCWETEPRSNQGNLLPWAFDHDHSCHPKGKGCPDCFRGVLCSNCNRSLGYAKDSAAIMQRGADYLEAWDIRKEGPAEGPSNLE